jgi:hypothetical protein
LIKRWQNSFDISQELSAGQSDPQGGFPMVQFEPRILAFLCNWCAYAGADLAGISRLQYPPNVRNIRVMCSATISPHHILKAFQKGADGVFVGG